MRHVEVTWDDAWHSQESYSLADIKKLQPHPTKSMGVLVRADKKIVVVAQSWDDDSYSEILVVPRGMVKRIRDL